MNSENKPKCKPLNNFFGILSKESGERLEKTIYELRKKRNVLHKEKIKELLKHNKP